MNKFIIITVASETNNELNRFLNSLKIHNLNYIVLGLDQIWNGGDMANGSGGGQKVNLLKSELRKWDDNELNSTLILFSDSYDVINLSTSKEIIKKYEKLGIDKIIFSSEKTCWPDSKLSTHYPSRDTEYKYLNSGGFIGMAKDILELINESSIKDEYDDQLFYTNLFLFEKTNIILDYYCEIFQTLNNAEKDIQINTKCNRIVNRLYNTIPCLIHGNGPKKIKDCLSRLNEMIIENNVYIFS
jgi:hypothetical protein